MHRGHSKHRIRTLRVVSKDFIVQPQRYSTSTTETIIIKDYYAGPPPDFHTVLELWNDFRATQKPTNKYAAGVVEC